MTEEEDTTNSVNLSSTITTTTTTTTTTTASTNTGSISTSSSRKNRRVLNEKLIDEEESDKEDDDNGEDANEEDPLQEVQNIYNYYVLQDSLHWWHRSRDQMIQSLIVNPPWKEIIRALIFLFVGAALVIFGCLIYYDMVSFMESRAGITMIVAGSLLFIPGIYVTVIAIRACLKIGDTTYDDIPGASL